jgi:hypothetical protein
MARELFASKLTSIWIGGFFFWILKGFHGSYQNMISKKYETRNSWVGYFLMLAGALGLVYFIVKDEL